VEINAWGLHSCLLNNDFFYRQGYLFLSKFGFFFSDKCPATYERRSRINPPMKEGKESRLRSILKTFSWRIIATTTTVSIAYFIFGDISNALKVGGIEFFAKMIIYYFHERAWQLVPYGSIRGYFGIKSDT
jgi:uncharacterized membrane protein